MGVGNALVLGSWSLVLVAVVPRVREKVLSLLLKGARVVDSVNGIDGTRDVLIERGLIAKVGADLPAGSAQVVDVTGLLVTPGQIGRAHV